MAANPETKQQFLDALKQGTHILVTVKTDPSIDQLASCIALTVLLNGLGKRATAVFSGKVPQAIDFLKPGKMLQTNTDSLQDFIISLDKAKADKLRYKVEDTMVKIYITPYQASLSDRDLVYSKGDFNVDTVIALGAHSQSEIDKAVTAHGRILHDAKVLTMDTAENATSDLGSINWADGTVSSLSELIARSLGELAAENPEALDSQVATALLAGIVAETESFGNGKTTPLTMEVAGHLLAAGANQELVSSRLSGVKPTPTQDSSTSNSRKQKSPQNDKAPVDLSDGASEEFVKSPAGDKPAKKSDKGGKSSGGVSDKPSKSKDDGAAEVAAVVSASTPSLEELSGLPDFDTAASPVPTPVEPAAAEVPVPTPAAGAVDAADSTAMPADTVTFDHSTVDLPAAEVLQPAGPATDTTLDPNLFTATPAPAAPAVDASPSLPADAPVDNLGVLNPADLSLNEPKPTPPPAAPPLG